MSTHDNNHSNNHTMEEFGEAAKEMASKAAAGLKEFGSNVVEASKGFVNNAKLNAAKTDKQKELDSAYKKLGELAYQSGDLKGEMKDLADKIGGLYSELQQIEMNLNKEKD